MKLFSGLKKSLLFTGILALLPVIPAGASPTGNLKKLTPDDFKYLYADSWRAVGHNIIIEGNACLPLANMEICADKIIVNTQSSDFEAIGHISIYRWQNGAGKSSLDKIAEMEQSGNVVVRAVSSSASLFNERSFDVKFSYQTDRITADKITGNLQTGYFDIINPVVRYTNFVCMTENMNTW